MKKRVIMISLLSGLLVGCNNINNSDKIVNNEIEGRYEFISESSICNSYLNSSSTTNESTQSNSESKMSETEYIEFDKNIKLYLNPSVQYTNSYASNLGNEGTIMNEISNILEDLLVEHTNIEIYSNNKLPGLALVDSVNESNNIAVDYHLALHSNAGGGKGSEGWYTKSSYNFTKSIIDSLQEILPYPTRGLKDGSKNLYELKNTTANACLIEILFHDDENQAKFLVNHEQEVAEAIYDGVVNYFKNN